jgi:copper(I)-binding protein
MLHDHSQGAVLKTRISCGRYGWLAFAVLMAAGGNDAAAIFVAREAWLRPAARASSTEAYVEVTSTEGATLVGARSPAANSVEIRAPGKSRTAIGEIALPAGKTLLLAPNAYRLVLHGLNRSLRLGDRISVILIVKAEDGSQREIALDAEVRLRSATDDHLHPHKH